MLKITKLLILIVFLATFSIHSNSETSWITKKDGNKKKVVKYTQNLTKISLMYKEKH